jgi:hypothetical protein
MRFGTAALHAAVAGTLVLSLSASPVVAGCYSDNCQDRQRGSMASQSVLNHGGTYGGAASAYMNGRYGYGTGRNTDVYSPYGTSGGAAARPRQARPMTPQERADYNRVMNQADRWVDHINNDPVINGRTRTRTPSPQDRAEIDRTIQRSQTLIDRINNDPLVGGGMR